MTWYDRYPPSLPVRALVVASLGEEGRGKIVEKIRGAGCKG